MPLKEYIALHFKGNNAEFGRHMGVITGLVVHRNDVGRWCKNGYIVVNGIMYSPRKEVV